MRLRNKLAPLALVGVLALTGCADGTDDPVDDTGGIEVPQTTLVPDEGTTDTSMTDTTMVDETTPTTGA